MAEPIDHELLVQQLQGLIEQVVALRAGLQSSSALAFIKEGEAVWPVARKSTHEQLAQGLQELGEQMQAMQATQAQLLEALTAISENVDFLCPLLIDVHSAVRR